MKILGRKLISLVVAGLVLVGAGLLTLSIFNRPKPLAPKPQEIVSPVPEMASTTIAAVGPIHEIIGYSAQKRPIEIYRFGNGGKLLVLEFSKVAKPLEKAYDWYSFKVLPQLGKWVAGDDASYRYLAESIRMHPDQRALKALMQDAGFGHVDYHNLSAGIVALHVGIKC